MDWIETTLRKGTKTPKICRDMFVTDSRGEFFFCKVSNGRMKSKVRLSEPVAKDLIREKNLVPTASIFSNCYTYRTQKSTDLVYGLLNA
jgi:hypothetical protein